MQSRTERTIRGSLSQGLAAAALLAGAACSHAKPSVATAPEPATAPPPVVQPAVAEAPAPPAPLAVKTESLFFDFDRSELQPEGQTFLSEFGGLLAKHPELHVRVEGNCDERGSSQYNVALGYRRAEAAKKYLLGMGAHDDQVKTVSYGKERPRAEGHDEAAWRQNRRDDLIADHDTLPVAGNP